MIETKIDWVRSTWNPITGCNFGCEYCYARAMVEKYDTKEKNPNIKAVVLKKPVFVEKEGVLVRSPYPYGFIPTLHRYRLEEFEYRSKKARSIFIGSMADIWGDWVSDEWLNDVFKTCNTGLQHTYLFLTKNPRRYKLYFEGAWQDISREQDMSQLNFLRGITVTETGDLEKIRNDVFPYIDFVSIEPILGDVDLTKCIDNLKWVIIGAETGDSPNKTVAKKEWVDGIISQCYEKNIPIFMKSSLIEIMGEDRMIRDYPW